VADHGGSETAIAVFTAFLVFATIALVLVTKKLSKATQLLATKTQEDFTRRKAQETVAAWERIRDLIEPGGLPRLTSDSRLPDAMRPILRKLEYFGACVNSDVYDLNLFSQLSGSWFLQQYDRILPYIETRQNPRAYADLKELRARVHRVGPGGGTLPTDGDPDL